MALCSKLAKVIIVGRGRIICLLDCDADVRLHIEHKILTELPVLETPPNESNQGLAKPISFSVIFRYDLVNLKIDKFYLQEIEKGE